MCIPHKNGSQNEKILKQKWRFGIFNADKSKAIAIWRRKTIGSPWTRDSQLPKNYKNLFSKTSVMDNRHWPVKNGSMDKSDKTGCFLR